MVQRLPVVNSDDGTWGTILNNFLGKEHYSDGTDTGVNNGGHKTVSLQPGVSTAGGAPLKFLTSGAALLTTAEAGAVEFVSDWMHYTQNTSTVRRVIAAYAGTPVTGDIHYIDSGGYFATLGIAATGTVLTVSAGGIPSWVAPAVSITQGQVLATGYSNGIL